MEFSHTRSGTKDAPFVEENEIVGGQSLLSVKTSEKFQVKTKRNYKPSILVHKGGLI